MFVDIHSHIIPGLDDDSRNLDMTLKMLKAVAADGTGHIVASDAHSNNARTTELSKAAGLVKRKFGKAVAERLFYENGMAVLKDGLIDMT
ncbi:MAG: hypothetical protein GXY17_12935 [Clostridiaceae bacterium]|nr:hypothetical protein [Clostridiaceae bacterium]NLV37562.1 hypothetical protein [Clostridiaceae bacterium]